MRVALLVEIHRAGNPSIAIRLHAMHIGVGANLTTPGALGDRNCRGKRTRFCADFAAEGQAESAVYAGAASRARLRKNRHRRRERMPAHLARGTFEDYARALHRKRWHRIRLRAWR